MAAHATGLEGIELERLRERLGQLYAILEEAAAAVAPPAPGEWAPAVDLCEAEEVITVKVELPGVERERIGVTLSGSQLIISGEKNRRAPSRRRGISHLCSECSSGRFSRTLPLRWTISVREATAELRDGVLVVRLPKLKERRGAAFKIPVSEITS
ncbi:MAG TPA: Hsp20/alpha crystallin family protein [Pyrinomonadaceae bacterium]|jgi:HSP20 family protein|nr:Hsp20/alpha crystallin family protein [Pyrinomonadaceae bacterium]